MMLKHTPAISVLYSVRVTLTNHYWVTSDERRRFFLSIMKGASEHPNLAGAYQVIEELHAKRRSPTEDSSAQLLASSDQCLLLLRGDGSNASSCVRSLQYCRRV